MDLPLLAVAVIVALPAFIPLMVHFLPPSSVEYTDAVDSSEELQLIEVSLGVTVAVSITFEFTTTEFDPDIDREGSLSDAGLTVIVTEDEIVLPSFSPLAVIVVLPVWTPLILHSLPLLDISATPISPDISHVMFRSPGSHSAVSFIVEPTATVLSPFIESFNESSSFDGVGVGVGVGVGSSISGSSTRLSPLIVSAVATVYPAGMLSPSTDLPDTAILPLRPIFSSAANIPPFFIDAAVFVMSGVASTYSSPFSVLVDSHHSTVSVSAEPVSTSAA